MKKKITFLIQITSNYLDMLPPTLGQVTYKASLLHLQPRQMKLELIDLREASDLFDLDNWDEEEDEESEDEDEDFCPSLQQGSFTDGFEVNRLKNPLFYQVSP